MASSPSLHGPSGFSFELIRTASGPWRRRRACALRVLRHRELVVERQCRAACQQGGDAPQVSSRESLFLQRIDLFLSEHGYDLHKRFGVTPTGLPGLWALCGDSPPECGNKLNAGSREETGGAKAACKTG